MLYIPQQNFHLINKDKQHYLLNLKALHKHDLNLDKYDFQFHNLNYLHNLLILSFNLHKYKNLILNINFLLYYYNIFQDFLMYHKRNVLYNVLYHLII